MTNQNETSVDTLIADTTLSVREKFEKLMALDFPNRNALDNYRSQSTISKTQERVVMGFVSFYAVLFPLLCVFALQNNFKGMLGELVLGVMAMTVVFLPALLMCFITIKGAYIDKKLFRSFFFKWENGKNALKQWEQEEDDFQKSVEFLQKNVDVLSSNDLGFLSTCKTVPSWVSQWAKSNSAQREQTQEMKQLNTLFSETKSVRVQPMVEIEKTVEDSKNVSIFSKDVAKI